MVITKSKSPKPRRMDAGFLIPLIAEFGASLEALGYSRLTIGGYTDSARHFATWILDAGLLLDEICKDTVDRFARHHCHCAGIRRWNGVSRKYARRVGRFVSFLAERRFIAPAPCVAAEIIHPQILGYQRWLAVHRGLSDRSVSRQGRMIKRLLPALGEEPQAYSATTIRATVRAEAERCSPSQHQDDDERASRLSSLPRRVGPVPPRVGPSGAAGPAMAALGSAALPADRGRRTHDRLVRPNHAARSARPGDIATPRTARPACWRYLLHAS